MTEKGGSRVDPQIVFLEKSSRKLFLGLIVLAVLCVIVTLVPTGADKTIYSNLLSIIASGSALAFAINVIARQKLEGILPRLYFSLGLGLALWFMAEATWAYYEVVEGVQTPFPSVADAFWIAGYIPFFYFLVGILKTFTGLPKSTLVPILMASSVGIVLVANLLLVTYMEADFTTSEGIIAFLVSSAYPVADIFLIVPAVAAFILLRRGKLTFAPWATIVMATICYIIADAGFAYFVMGGMDDIVWMWNPLYHIGDFAIASALFWHRKFFTIDQKKLLRQWQENNR